MVRQQLRETGRLHTKCLAVKNKLLAELSRKKSFGVCQSTQNCRSVPSVVQRKLEVQHNESKRAKSAGQIYRLSTSLRGEMAKGLWKF